LDYNTLRNIKPKLIALTKPSHIQYYKTFYMFMQEL